MIPDSRGADGASATAFQPPPHLLTTLPAPAGGGRCVCHGGSGAGRASVPLQPLGRRGHGRCAEDGGATAPGGRGPGRLLWRTELHPSGPLARATDQQQQGKHRAICSNLLGVINGGSGDSMNVGAHETFHPPEVVHLRLVRLEALRLWLGSHQ